MDSSARSTGARAGAQGATRSGGVLEFNSDVTAEVVTLQQPGSLVWCLGVCNAPVAAWLLVCAASKWRPQAVGNVGCRWEFRASAHQPGGLPSHVCKLPQMHTQPCTHRPPPRRAVLYSIAAMTPLLHLLSRKPAPVRTAHSFCWQRICIVLCMHTCHVHVPAPCSRPDLADECDVRRSSTRAPGINPGARLGSAVSRFVRRADSGGKGRRL